ncbi:uncharacterized protein LOC134799713 [Cydia splendana]|uniref:uncharacterized protein LOC134799713 n=1 Tax=Cydia splendana TaxID=1100963 RepID=UPI00300D2E23
MAKAQWGLNPDILRTIFYTVVEPTILYAAGAWGSIAARVYAKKRLDSVTRAFAIKISKAHRTVSLISSATMARILPLDLRLSEQLELYEIKRGKPMSQLPGRELQIRVHPSTLPHPARRRRWEFSWVTEAEQIETSEAWNYYTDGSKIEGKVGAAVSVWEGDEEIQHASFRLENYCTVFQAEMMALHKATDMVLKSNRTATIHSDSRAALQAVSNPNTLNPIAVEIRGKIEAAKEKGRPVQLKWIKAHVGLAGNERADELAKQAALHNKRAPAYDKFPISYAKKTIRALTIEKWQNRYETAEQGAGTRLFFDSVRTSNKVMGKIVSSNIIAQMLTGHGGFKQYLHRFKLANDPFCPCDGSSEETVTHILIECTRFENERWQCEMNTDTRLTQRSLKQLMADDKTRGHLLKFSLKVLKAAARANGSTAL